MTQFRQDLTNMKSDGSLGDGGESRVLSLYRSSLQELITELQVIIKEWEQLDPEDARLYSLGLRHAVDLLESERDA
jgi:hypothetical protein